jgi:hypothetical protein
MKMLACTTLSISILCSSLAFAKPPRLPDDTLGEAWNRSLYIPYLDKIATVPDDRDRSRICDDMYSKVLAKREISIVFGLGYYDSSEGGAPTYSYGDGSQSGMNDTIDIAYKSMYRQLFTRKCSHQLRLCGMKETADGRFEKDVKSPQGEKVHVILEMRNSSLTHDHQTNVGPRLAEQMAKSDATTRWFFGSIPSADVVVYNGHSRKGGGPDFSPPKLLSNAHVNYPWYQRQTPGLNKLLQALEEPAKPSVLLLMSCNSKELFERKVSAVAPHTAFSGTKAVIPGDIATKGALGGIDSFLRFQCQDGYTREMNVTDDLARQLDPLKIRD